MSIYPQVNKPAFSVTPQEVDFFHKNYPVHYEVLLELVRRGEARITDAGTV